MSQQQKKLYSSQRLHRMHVHIKCSGSMITFLRNRCLCGTCYTNDLILSFDWDTILSCDIDLSVDLWTHHFLDIMKKCIPHRVVNTRCHLPWLTKRIAQLTDYTL